MQSEIYIELKYDISLESADCANHLLPSLSVDKWLDRNAISLLFLDDNRYLFFGIPNPIHHKNAKPKALHSDHIFVFCIGGNGGIPFLSCGFFCFTLLTFSGTIRLSALTLLLEEGLSRLFFTSKICH
jgi:hypothetical protein